MFDLYSLFLLVLCFCEGWSLRLIYHNVNLWFGLFIKDGPSRCSHNQVASKLMEGAVLPLYFKPLHFSYFTSLSQLFISFLTTCFHFQLWSPILVIFDNFSELCFFCKFYELKRRIARVQFNVVTSIFLS